MEMIRLNHISINDINRDNDNNYSIVLFKNDTDKGIVIANKDLYATAVIDIGED